MKKVPKVVNKLPIYLVLVLLIGFTFFILTGKFKLEVINVSANSADTANYIKITPTEDQVLSDILTTRNTIGFVSSSYCSNCNVLTIELKSFLETNSNYKVYEIDLDSSRGLLREANVEYAPSIIITDSADFDVRQNVSYQDLKEILVTEFSN